MSEKKQKILIVHNYYQIPGGEDTVVANEKKLLEDNGHQVILYTRHNKELKELNTIQKVLLPFASIFNIRTYREIKRIISQEQIDIVHVHNTLTLISPAVYYAAVKRKVPVIQTIHNFRFLCPGATFYRDEHICEECLEKGLRCAVKHSCYRGSKLQTLLCVINSKIHRALGIYKKINYICLTEFNKQKLLQHGQIKEAQIYIKPNFVENDMEVIPYEERKKQFVFIGRLDKLKGIDKLLEAWNMLEDKTIKLVVCGIGPMEEWCHAYAKEHGLTNVEFKGYVKNIDARKIIGESKSLIVPSQWYEGFPMNMVEAWSLGTPIIASDSGNVGKIIDENAGGWKFKTHNTSDFVSTIINVNHQKSFENLELKKIQKKYSGEKNYESILNIYRGISICENI